MAPRRAALRARHRALALPAATAGPRVVLQARAPVAATERLRAAATEPRRVVLAVMALALVTVPRQAAPRGTDQVVTAGRPVLPPAGLQAGLTAVLRATAHRVAMVLAAATAPHRAVLRAMVLAAATAGHRLGPQARVPVAATADPGVRPVVRKRIPWSG